MSYFDDASLVFIPSGTKTSKAYSVKPIDGTGDLTFTRSNDTASRVASNGLIQKVRTNLITYSQAFDNAAWTKGGVGTYTSAITTGFTDPNGGTNAQRWLATIASVSDRAFVRQLATLTNGIPYTISFWVKSNTASSQDIYFMFQGGAVQATTATTSWQRISYSATTSTTSVLVGIEAKSLAIDVLIYGFQLEVGDIMTDYIATTSAAVSVGPVANVPRLDYLNSSCPRLLLEPQRTNLALYSEQFDNAAINKLNATITANNATSPDGTQNADLITETTTNGIHICGYDQASITSGTTYTASVFLKKTTGSPDWMQVAYSTAGLAGFANFNLTTGAVGNVVSGGSAKIENYGNGWYRCSLTQTANATGTGGGPIIVFTNNTNPNQRYVSYAGSTSVSILAWGAQLEVGAYATSYIPTLGSASTRAADACSKTGISSLIGGTSGTIFFEIKTNKTLTSTNFKQFFYYTDASASQAYMYLNGSNYLVTNPSLGNFTGSLQFQADTTYKVAIAYASNDFKLYVNGVERGSSTSGTPINAVNLLSLGSYAGSAEFNEMTFAQYLHFKTRLTNAQLAELTSL